MDANIEKTDNLTETPVVFISYSSKNKDIADVVVAKMEQHNIKCWYAPRDIRPGDQWVNAIKNALVKTGVFVLIYTEESNSSEQVKNEVALAFNEGKVIVPFKISDCDMDNELEYYLTRVHWLDAFNIPLEKSTDSLVEHVESLLENGKDISYKDNVELSKNNPQNKKKKSRAGLIVSLAAVLIAVILTAVVVFAGGLSIVLINVFGGSAKMMNKGLEYYNTRYLGEEDNKKAGEYFEKAAKKGKEDAYYYLGKLYEREFDFKNAEKCYKTGIENGSSLSEYGLAYLYANGKDVPLDIEKANELVNDAMGKGCVEAYYLEGLLVQKGLSDKFENADAKEALEYYEKALECKDLQIKSMTYINMGDVYKKGVAGVEKDFDKSFDYYMKAIECYEANEGLGYFSIALLYLSCDEDLKADDYYRAALEYYEKAAEAGNLESMNRLGYMYEGGRGCIQDGEKAMEYYKKASENGNYYSLYNMGVLYEHGNDPLKKNTEKAYEYYKKASDLGYEKAMKAIGLMYCNGDYGLVDDEPDYNMALQWLKKAAENGNYDSYSELGDMYLNGMGVETDYLKAKEYYQMGCDKCNGASMNAMGYYYYKGYEGKPDYEEAMKWFKKASYNGSSTAKRNIGLMYENGEGVEQSYEEAEKWYLLSAEEDNQMAINTLAFMYYNGEKTGEPDNEAAYKWFKKGASLGNKTSMFMVGICYYDGRLPEGRDYEKAYYWFTKAAENGEKLAYGLLGEMSKEGRYLPKDIDKAKEYYRKGVELNDPSSCLNLGEIYYDEGNYEGAVECYKKVWEENMEAAYRLGMIYYEGIEGVVSVNYLSAKPYFKKAADMGMDDEEFWNRFGVILFETEDNEAAAKCFEKAFEFNHNPKAAYKTGINYFYMNDYENAAIWFGKALENGYDGNNDLKGTINEWVKDGMVIKPETLEYIAPWLEN